MSAVSHTPGPWRYRKGDDVLPAVVQRGDEGGFVVQGLSRERAEADARLIAAAPDLLAELEHLVLLMEPLERDGGLHIPGLATLNAARAAIKKAKAA